jgi:hypothetical protein
MVVTENLSNKPSEITRSTPRQTSKPQIWKPGQSGNPAGRPKGVKNAITLKKQILELELREKSEKQIHKVLAKAFELALAGDRMMIKMLLEFHISKAAAVEEEGQGKSQVAVVIQNLTNEPAKQEVITVTPKEP